MTEVETSQFFQKEYALLSRLLGKWKRRAGARASQALPKNLLLEDKLDFPPELVPFVSHPLFAAAPEEKQRQVYSCAWILYNEKAIQLETCLVGPACIQLARGRYPGVEGEVCIEAIHEVFADEGMHILLLNETCDMTRRHRALEHVSIGRCTLVDRMEMALLREPEVWKQDLMRLACAIVAEVSIGDYLGHLRRADDRIQPLHAMITEWHRKDELAHAGVFNSMARFIYHSLNERERVFLVKALWQAEEWFDSPEPEIWQGLLEQIDFPNRDAMLDEWWQGFRPQNHGRLMRGLKRILRTAKLDASTIRKWVA